MESAEQKFDRLLTALESLAQEETALVEAAEYSAAQDVQVRIQPVAEALAQLAPQVRAAAARMRLDAVVARRRQSIGLLESRMAAVQSELHALQQSTQRVARIAPVYGRPKSGAQASRLRASG